MTRLTSDQWEHLNVAFGENLQRKVPLARFTASRVGGPADAMVVAESVDHLAEISSKLWALDIPFRILGGGSNILFSDKGIRGVVVLNRAKEIAIDETHQSVWAGSGVSFGQMSRRVSSKGYSGLEWAVGIPGTVGGAVYGNAGAHGGDVAGNLLVAEILHRFEGRGQWTAARLGFSYRSSTLKQESFEAIILSASFKFEISSPEATRNLVDKYGSWRKKNQPSGASMGSIFKNPPGDFAGRLIEAAGLKGTRIGAVEISSIHANFFINHGGTRAQDILAMIQMAQQKVMDKFGVHLEMEIELAGDWDAYND